ncbi:hypothetical protein PilKf_02527 [Pillotina sp. SPG140]
MKNVILCLCFLFIILASITYAQEQETEKKLFPPIIDGLFTNAVFHGTARLFGADFAQTNWDSLQTNLSSIWVWDNDGFLFNHPGHPYQGSLYHTAARANGFTFYESFAFDALGSFTWEVFGETDIPSLNDLIITTAGGAVFGEILHRLYLETASPFAFSISPMDALNNLVLGRKPFRKQRNIYHLSTNAGGAWITASKAPHSQFENIPQAVPENIYTANTGFNVIYGDPFRHASNTPYAQFEMSMQIGAFFSPLWFDWTILTDGYLFSYNPLDTKNKAFSTGLTLHYDAIAGTNINFAANSLDWTVKYQRRYSESFFELKAHAGWMIFGSSQYFSDNSLEDTVNDYGTGANIKLVLSLKGEKLGNLNLGTYNYFFYMLPLAEVNMEGIEYFSLSYLDYSHLITKNLSIGVNFSFYLKMYTLKSSTDFIVQDTKRTMLYLKWAFIDKRHL